MEEKSSNKPVSAFTLFTKSKDLVIANYQVFGTLLLLPFVMSIFSQLSSRPAGNALVGREFSGAALGLGFAGVIVFLVLNVIVSIMTYILATDTANGKKPTLKDVWEKFKKVGGQLFMLQIVVGLIIVGGFIALIVPGLIFIRRYFLAPYVMLDQNLSIGDSLKESARISKLHSGSVWGLIGVTILLSLPGAVPVVGWIISFALTSLYTVAPALRYFELKKLAGKV